MVGDKPDLGRQIAQFKANFTYFLVSLLAAAVLLVLGFYTAVQTLFMRPEIEMASFLLTLLLLGLGVSLALFAFQRFADLGASYVLYERGVKRLDSNEPRIVSWDEVKVVQRASRTIAVGREGSKEGGGRQWRIWKLISEDGNSFTISDQPRLASMIVGMLLVHHWPTIQGRIENGEKVALNRILVSKEGLEYKGYLIPWSRIKRADTADHIKLDTISGPINWPEINSHDDDDVLGYLMLRRAIEYYS